MRRFSSLSLTTCTLKPITCFVAMTTIAITAVAIVTVAVTTVTMTCVSRATCRVVLPACVYRTRCMLGPSSHAPSPAYLIPLTNRVFVCSLQFSFVTNLVRTASLPPRVIRSPLHTSYVTNRAYTTSPQRHNVSFRHGCTTQEVTSL